MLKNNNNSRKYIQRYLQFLSSLPKKCLDLKTVNFRMHGRNLFHTNKTFKLIKSEYIRLLDYTYVETTVNDKLE